MQAAMRDTSVTAAITTTPTSRLGRVGGADKEVGEARGDTRVPCGAPASCSSTAPRCGEHHHSSTASPPASSAAGRLDLQYACCTQAGLAGGKAKENQDSWVVKEHVGGSQVVMLGVFDGHGEHGKAASNVVATALPKVVSDTLKALDKAPTPVPSTHADVLTYAFDEVSDLLPRIGSLNLCLSGTTAVVAMLDANRLVVANLGDSRCVLGRVDKHGHPGAMELTNDHKPEVLAEAARVLAAGGRIAPYAVGSKLLGSLRVWLPDRDIPGLSMTRCFGDTIAASVGVTAEPEVLDYALTAADRYLVLMSDGVSQYIGSNEVIGIVHRCASEDRMKPSQVAQTLVREARRRWVEQEPSTADDCTCIVVFLEPLKSVDVSETARWWKRLF